MGRLTLLAVLLLLVTGTQAGAWVPDLSPGGTTWDFAGGTQNWSVYGNAAAHWVDPAVEPGGPVLPDGDTSHAGADNLFLPDSAKADLDVTSRMLGNGPGKRGFQLLARCYIPNLRPVTDFSHDLPGNMNHGAGIGAFRADGKGVCVFGDITYGSQRVRDTSWDSTNRGPSWTMEELTEPDSLWWDDWIILALDYSYSTPGYYNAAIFIPWESPRGGPGWITLAEGIGCNPDVHFVTLRAGSVTIGSSWTQAQFDDVWLKQAPEPASVLALGAGLIGFVGMLRRRG
jgi:hypothetical protein